MSRAQNLGLQVGQQIDRAKLHLIEIEQHVDYLKMPEQNDNHDDELRYLESARLRLENWIAKHEAELQRLHQVTQNYPKAYIPAPEQLTLWE